ncbi:VOC family protein [Streptomyces sp. NPDC048297]|uniref:VOC family protein n=1 Tax=Streptomyces sp. NPDC048297 TaxID=3365531 RepID=UPI003714A25E
MTTQPAPVAAIHHVALVTHDAQNLSAWYRDLLGFEHRWTLTAFSELTRRRLPGIQKIEELRLGDFRIHLLEVPSAGPSTPVVHTANYQHLCLVLRSPEELRELRDRWEEKSRGGRYSFRTDPDLTDIVVDSDGVHSFYAFDPDGLEWEFTCIPAGSEGR